MATSRPRSLASAFVAAVPLVIVAGIVLWGALRPHEEAAPAKAAAAGVPLAGLPAPAADLPADRLHERVDGAEDYLRSQGCVRLLAWDLAEPKASLDLLVFQTVEGAGSVLARDAGKGRTAGPGDEASADEQSVLFRRGRVYVRLLADTDAPTTADRLLAEATKVDRAILDAMGKSL
jgi:hypothetical protein